jgi:hypothetical protein
MFGLGAETEFGSRFWVGSLRFLPSHGGTTDHSSGGVPRFAFASQRSYRENTSSSGEFSNPKTTNFAFARLRDASRGQANAGPFGRFFSAGLFQAEGFALAIRPCFPSIWQSRLLARPRQKRLDRNGVPTRRYLDRAVHLRDCAMMGREIEIEPAKWPRQPSRRNNRR